MNLRAVRKGASVTRNSPLRWYNPFICKNRILRVGGRLKHSEEPDDFKHPMILPARHRCTRLLFEQYHLRLLHTGPQLLLGSIRQRYWSLGGRNVARLVVQQCLKCFRSEPKLVRQFMGELPASRVTDSRPFSKTGIDYFGPVFVRPGPRRVAVKAYGAIFVCMCTKAVHIELVSDLSIDRFLQALRRFIARRGRCTDLCGPLVRISLELATNCKNCSSFGRIDNIGIRSSDSVLMNKSIGTSTLPARPTLEDCGKWQCDRPNITFFALSVITQSHWRI